MKSTALVIIILFLVGCGDHAPPAQPPLPAMTVVAAAPGSVVQRLRLAGSLVARDEAIVAAEGISARIVGIAVDLGDSVVAGQELVRLDDAAIRVQLDGNSAERNRAAALIAQSQAQVAEARAVGDEARQALERGRQASANGAMSEELLGARVLAVATAEARIAAALAAVTVAQAEAERLAALRSELELSLRRTRIVAPIAGVVVRRSARIGAAAEPAVELLALASDGVIEFAGELPEQLLPSVAPGQPLQVEIAGALTPGRVRRIDPQVDALSRIGAMRVSLDTTATLHPGMSATALVELPPLAGILVPTLAIQRRDGRPGVLVATPDAGEWVDQRRTGSVRRVEVAVGREDGARTVLTAGLPAGTLVIAQAPDFLGEGARCVLVLGER